MDIFSLTPVSLCNAIHSSDMKSESLSKMICLMSPFLQYHSSKSTTATSASAAMAVECMGASHISAPNKSVIVRMVSLLPSSGRGPTKSKATASKRASGTGRGCRGLTGLEVWLLLHWQGEQEGIYACSRSHCMLGQ